MESLNVQEPVSVIPNTKQQEETTIVLPWWISIYRLLLNRNNWYEVLIPIDNCSLGYNQLILSSFMNDNESDDDNDDVTTNNGNLMKEIITRRYSTTMICTSLLLGIELNLLLSNSSDIGIRIRSEVDQQYSSSTTTATTTAITTYYWIRCCLVVSIIFCILSLVCIYSLWIIIDCIRDNHVPILLRSSIGQYITALPNRFVLVSVSTFIQALILLLFQMLPIQQGNYIPLIIITASSICFIHTIATISAFGRLIIYTNAGTIQRPTCSNNKVIDNTLGRISKITNHGKKLRQRQQQQSHEIYSMLFHIAKENQQSEFRRLRPSNTEYLDDATLTCDHSPNLINAATTSTPSSYLSNPELSELLNELSFYRSYHYHAVHQPQTQSNYTIHDHNHELSTVRNQRQQQQALKPSRDLNDNNTFKNCTRLNSINASSEQQIPINNPDSSSAGNNNNMEQTSQAKQLQYNNITKRVNGQRHLQNLSNSGPVYNFPSDRMVSTSDSFPTSKTSAQTQSQMGPIIHCDDGEKDVVNEEETISFQNYDEYYDCDVPIVEDKGVWYNGIYFGDDDEYENDMRINTTIQDPRDPTILNDDDYCNENEHQSETTRLIPKQQHTTSNVQSCPRTPVDQLERGKFYLSIIQETPNVENDEEDEE